MKIALTSINVKDPIAAHAFYTEKLGFVSHTFMPEANLAIVVSPEDSEGTSLLLEPSDHPLVKTFSEGIYAEGLPRIIFGVPDVREEYERLVGLGVAFKQEPQTSDWGTSAIFDDTCGNFIQIHQP